ncbi:MAG: FluC/FEX family fluoride channel [Wenzhouxiangella sp.]
MTELLPPAQSTWPVLMLAAAAGGGLGTVLRVLVNQFWLKAPPGRFAYGTLVVNASGSLALGLLLAVLLATGARSEIFIVAGVGLVGAYTTVSSLALESLLMLRAGRGRPALAYLTASLVSGPLLALLGLGLGGWLFGAGPA